MCVAHRAGEAAGAELLGRPTRLSRCQFAAVSALSGEVTLSGNVGSGFLLRCGLSFVLMCFLESSGCQFSFSFSRNADNPLRVKAAWLPGASWPAGCGRPPGGSAPGRTGLGPARPGSGPRRVGSVGKGTACHCSARPEAGRPQPAAGTAVIWGGETRRQLYTDPSEGKTKWPETWLKRSDDEQPLGCCLLL